MADWRLDLRFLIDRQHQRVLRRIDVEADDILHLGGKLRVIRQLDTSKNLANLAGL
jgi:hypothetical protein